MTLFSSEIINDPYPRYAEWRENSPIWYSEQARGWVVTKYDDVRAILTDPATYSSHAGDAVQEQALYLPLLMDDPPRHTQLRGVVRKAFTSSALKNTEPLVDELVERLLDELDPSSPVDISDNFTIPLPVAVISELMGIPHERKDDFKRWSDALTNTGEASSMEERMPEVFAMTEYFRSLIPERRKNPGDDLVSAVVHADVDGQKLDENDIVGFVVLLLVAGNETTTNLLSNLLSYMANHPDDWATLRSDPANIDIAIEETLRYDAPVQWVTRRVAAATELNGISIEEGELVWALMGSANRDSDHYDDPNSFRFDRAKSTDHHTFGYGIHFCIGAPLARLEARFGLKGLAHRFEKLSHASGHDNERTHSGQLRGFHHLWLNLEPAEAAG